jgi:hypothetical protein
VKSLIGDITPKSLASTPQDVSESPVPANLNDGPETESGHKSGAIGASSWNHAGTWEERDISTVAKARLQELCLLAKSELPGFDMNSDPTAMMDIMKESLDLMKDGTGGSNQGDAANSLGKLGDAMATLRATVTSVKKMEGEAQIVMARGKKRCVYDFNVNLDFEIEVDEAWKDSLPSGDTGGATKKSKTIKGSIAISDLTALDEFDAVISYKKALPTSLEKRIRTVTDKLRSDLKDKIKVFESEYSL